jgi:phosphoribosylamine--glycine ligase
MKVLLVGSGGREHALAWKLAQSHALGEIYFLPGNPGTGQFGENIEGDVDNLDGIVDTAITKRVDLVVIGPEIPLALGLADRLSESEIPVFGPSSKAARIESSKAFAKDFMRRHSIPTARYCNFVDFEEALSYLSTLEYPFVIKASGLAAGKGVFLPDSILEAESVLRQVMVERSFGNAGDVVVIEERLSGREVSLLAFTDGNTVLPMPPAQDHKRLLDGDRGPNTGGMGVFAPSPYIRPEIEKQVVKDILQSVVDGLRKEGSPFVGVIYAGLILTESGPKVLEFNSRFGDPETQVILPLLESDLLTIMKSCVNGRLSRIGVEIRWRNAAAVCVVLASPGYPGRYPKNLPVSGLDRLPAGVIAFHAGTRMDDRGLLTNGGRVLGVTAVGSSLDVARHLAYDGASGIYFEGMHYRKDIAYGV